MAVYFIQAGEGGPVKIGIANDPAARLREMQCANFLTLRVLRVIAGGRAEEYWLHHHYRAARVRGEWFTFDPSMHDVQPGSWSDLSVDAADPILPEVEKFIEASGLTASAFGMQAVGDPNFVFALRNGREPRRATRERVLQVLRESASQPERASA